MNNNNLMETFYLETPSLERKNEIIDYINEFVEHKSDINGTGSLDKILVGYTLIQYTLVSIPSYGSISVLSNFPPNASIVLLEPRFSTSQSNITLSNPIFFASINPRYKFILLYPFLLL